MANPPGYYAANTEHCKKVHAAWRARNHEHVKTQALEYRIRTKLEVLSHYGPNGLMQCSWPGCFVDDPDMLSLDHVNDDGAQDRKTMRTGITLYGKLRKQGFPPGFQTLCHNHQWKKEIMRRREGEL